MARNSRKRSSDYHFPKTVEELPARNIRTITDLVEDARNKLSRGDRIAAAITRYCGTIRFVWINVGFFVLWMLFNTLPGFPHVDPFPFVFLTFILSLEAIFLSVFILITQNRQEQINERRAHLDLQINLLAEQESTKLLHLVREIAVKVGVDPAKDPDVSVLEEATRPEKLIEQIDAKTQANGGS
jgi:uncharacterized membrane protein